MESSFLFTTCQIGAERVLKAEMARLWPGFRPAFARPGFITFKLSPKHGLADSFDPRAVFARSRGFSIGKVTGQGDGDIAAAAHDLATGVEFDEIHVVGRGDNTSEFVSAAAVALAKAHGLQSIGLGEPTLAVRLAKAASAKFSNPLVLDCILVEPNEWWLGFHRVVDVATSWPGGWHLKALPEYAVSRAYLKMDEALMWSQMPVSAGDQVAEVGCAPGGASQALLDRGLTVLGIDPAEVDERVLANPHFTHFRKRGHEVKRREFRKTRWLTADMNVAPQYTLDTVEAIVTHTDVDVRGMLLTLKMLEWTLADEIPTYLERIRSWGYGDVRARQLSHNRREICVAARRKGYAT